MREPSKSEEEHKSLLTFETLVDNKVSIRLCDTQDNNYYLPSATQEVQVTLVFNNFANPLA